ncbi:Nitrate and nitrite sensing [Achromobacter denitrificans]|uniref:nitrate- and nitrite sensing domain-containing protein n=1 Tax=Achromobacter denitrificans TaxID=32002 RepID=UPI0007884FB8|nr:nitrate- and nitrite sensing domain-containing protein [Achromobacter denitrificans]OLU04404.1 antitermination regulator [Achromobacter denitrificans]QKH41767.1 nitrate- and nitrite sensing domain-containing protein [Achromobacter denitrificans]QKH51089.1 nitrate- and nitrite sensing domain-containing protein [Achromobacter denitrificans]CAB3733323.1 Nitrate regulatory protein [Achromobacter denitrificans]SUU25047.1 Nitrate and nitrite sensing [Achromobacter denitrificans]
MAERHMPPPLRFLLAARRSELHGLEALAGTCELVLKISALVHALQKERGYSNLTLCGDDERLLPALAGLSDEAGAVEGDARAFLDGLETGAAAGAGRARLLNCIAYALFRLDELPRLRRQVRDRRVPAHEADSRFTLVIASLLAVVVEAADSALDAGVTRNLVALLNFMQGKELSGQERACGVMGFTAGWFSDEQKARMLGLAANQARSFDSFAQYAQDAPLQCWEQARQHDPQVQRMRDMAQRTSDTQRVDGSLAGLWFDLCTARIDAMRDMETRLAHDLAQHCARRIAETRQELDDRRLLLSRYADHASGRAPSLVFSVQSRILDAPPQDGVGKELERSILDMMREQALRMQRADDALSSVRGALDESKRIDRAKLLLISRYGLAEPAAHERLQRAAMDGGLSLAEAARRIVEQLGEG